MYNEIKHLYPNAEAQIDFELRDDGQGAGVYIHHWDTVKLGPQPTAAQFAAVKVAALLAFSMSSLIKKIKADANKITVDTIGELSNEYVKAKADADAFKAAGYIGTVTPSVASWATAKGWTAAAACDDILAAAAGWVAAQDSIRANRLLRTEEAKRCTTQAGLDIVSAQWATFATAIRVSLAD